MNWLIWKEYRLHRPILILGAILMVIPYCEPLLEYAFTHHASHRALAYLYDADSVFRLCLSSILTGWFTIALLGGHAIAGERAERAAEFFAYLPVPRWQSLISKLAIPFLTAVVVFGVNLLIMLCVTGCVAGVSWEATLADVRVPLLMYSCAAVAAFSIGWLLSSFLDSATFSIVGGLVLPLLEAALFALTIYLFDIDLSEDALATILAYIWCVTAAICFPTGTWYFLHRVQP